MGGDRRTNSAEQPEDDDKADSPSPKQIENDVREITGASNAREKNEQRRESLLSMLHASEKRHKLATSRRQSVLAKGVEVIISQGESAGETAVILDADYINNRVLLSLNEQTAPLWLPFSHVNSSGKSDPHLAS